MLSSRSLLVVALAATLSPLSSNTLAAQKAKRELVVFVLAGQSNMEGKAQNKLLEFQARDAKTKDFYAHLFDGETWRVRDDVFIDFLGRRGPLTMGFGSRGRTGCELEFGHVMGEHFKQPVLLIKTAWGGRAIGKTFRPPSAGLPEPEVVEKELAKRQKRKKDFTRNALEEEYGRDYRKMIERVRDVTSKLGEYFPKLKSYKPRLHGFVWFQGWNDQYGGLEKEYASNLEHLIRDVRRDLKAPELKVVVAAMGQNGSKKAKGAMKTIQEAQLGIVKREGFRGNVTAIRTDELIDRTAEKHYPTWRKNMKTWEKVGSDHPYHYLGSGIWFTRIGRKMATAMLDMLAPGHSAGEKAGKPAERKRR